MIRRLFIITLSLLPLGLAIHAEAPEFTPVASYYRDADGRDGEELRLAIHRIIRNHEYFRYRKVWEFLKRTDADPENPDRVLLIYSGRSVPGRAQEGAGKNGPDAWNREHVWPRSHGLKEEFMKPYTDLHHLRPSDITINSARGNKDFDNCRKALREAPQNHYSRHAFEPRDAVKGDIARMLFYMDVRYEGESLDEPDLRLVDSVDTSGPLLGKLCTLYRWHRQDPVDDFERRRNEVIFVLQKNRNPFIDRPEWVQNIWGNICEKN
jgi:endonuclease I